MLKSFEQRLLQSIGEKVPLKLLEDDMRAALLSIKSQVIEGAFTSEQLCLIHEQAARIKNIAQLFATLEKSSVNVLDAAKQKFQDILADDSTIETPPRTMRSQVQSTSIQETLNSKILRRWFLDNIADPFPSLETKKELIETTNALLLAAPPSQKTGKPSSNQPIDYTKCSLWFVNTRRRSHWTDFFREFAQSDKEKMHCLVECLKREEGVDEPGSNEDLEKLLQGDKDEVQYSQDELAQKVKECRKAYTAITDWLLQILKDKVGDWMDDVIREAKMQLKEEKAAMKEVMKRRAELREKDEEEREHQRQKLDISRERSRGGSVDVRSADIIQRRKIAERKERQEHRRLPSALHTPESGIGHTQFNDSSVGESSRTSSGSSQCTSSLFDSSDRPPPSSSCSSSSLASYDACHRAPGSPTLSILKNSQAKLLNQVQEEVQMLITNTASLYTSAPAPRQVSPIPSHPERSLLLASPVEMHLENSLSGGSCSRFASAALQAGGKLESVDPYSSSMGW